MKKLTIAESENAMAAFNTWSISNDQQLDNEVIDTIGRCLAYEIAKTIKGAFYKSDERLILIQPHTARTTGHRK